MNMESIFRPNKKGALATAIGLSLSITACLSLTACKEIPPPALDKLPGVTATPSTITVAEGDDTTFEVELDTEPKGNITVFVESLDTTEATTDVTELTFTNSKGDSPWNIPQTVTVNGLDDNLADGNQNINIKLGIKQVLQVLENIDTDYSELAPTNVATIVTDTGSLSAAGFTVSTRSLATTEKGDAVSYTVALNTEPDAAVVVDVVSQDPTEGSISPAALIFNSSNWQAPQEVAVVPVDDLKADGNQTYDVSMTVNANGTVDTTGYATLTLPPVTVTNADDDTAGFTVSTRTLGTAENGAVQNYTVVLNTEPGDSVTVDVTSLNTNEGTVVPAILTFSNTNWSDPQMVSVTPVDDLKADGNQSYNISMVVSPGTADATGYADLVMAPVAVSNADDDIAGFTVSDTTLDTTENGTTTSYTVTLNTEPDAAVVIDVASENVMEGTVDKEVLTFDSLDWQTPQTVTVAPVDDFVMDGNQLYDVSMTVNAVSTTDTTGYAALNLPAVAVSNADDDIAGFSVSATTLATVENGTTASYTVVLNTQPGDAVVIDIASEDSTEGSVSPATLTFNGDDWQTAQTVTVAPVDDAEVDGSQSYNVSMTVNTSSTFDNTGYLALSLAPVAVTNADDDEAAPDPGPNSADNPIQVTSLPYSGTSEAQSTYYEISGLTAGTTYNVSLTGLSGGVDLYVFTAVGFTNQECTSFNFDADDESCLATATTTSLWVRVDQDHWTLVGLPGGDFSLNLTAQ